MSLAMFPMLARRRSSLDLTMPPRCVARWKMLSMSVCTSPRNWPLPFGSPTQIPALLPRVLILQEVLHQLIGMKLVFKDSIYHLPVLHDMPVRLNPLVVGCHQLLSLHRRWSMSTVPMIPLPATLAPSREHTHLHLNLESIY